MIGQVDYAMVKWPSMSLVWCPDANVKWPRLGSMQVKIWEGLPNFCHQIFTFHFKISDATPKFGKGCEIFTNGLKFSPSMERAVNSSPSGPGGDCSGW